MCALCDVCECNLGHNYITTRGLSMFVQEDSQFVALLDAGDYCHGCFVKALQPHIKGLCK